MATIIPFPTLRTGDWSESERARLNELAKRFADQTSIDVVFGRSDSGDPWCVILDAQDEVLVHVARVKGGFVAHSPAGDVFAQTADLRSAVERVLGPRWQEERLDVVVPFAAGNRQAQLVAAAIVVTSFVYHHRAEAAGTDEWALADIAAVRTGVPIAKLLQRDEVAQFAHVASTWDLAEFDSLGGPALSSASKTDLFPAALQHGYAASNAGTMHGKAFHAGEAAGIADAQPAADAHPVRLDLPDAAPPEAATMRGGLYHDLVEGGSGDDLLVLDNGAFAIGGDGADSFAVRAPDAPAAAKVAPEAAPLLGVIVDFTAGVDKVIAEGGLSFNLVSNLPVGNILADSNVHFGNISLVLPGERIGIDFDGDNREDGYLLVGNAGNPGLIEAVKAALQSHGQNSNGAEHPSPQFEPSHAVHDMLAMIAPTAEVI